MKYRADIDGLRALAVIPVVLFHANFPFFKGGFVGVDIFFVISGYLITHIIADEISEGRFSIINFYERRIRRIFPALFTVLLFTVIIGTTILMPTDFKKMADSLIAAVLFSANFFFWKQQGYFDVTSDAKPLLHIWSLSVEEQFYFLFPVFLILCWKFIGIKWKWLTWAGLLVSLFLSVYTVKYYNNSTFFLLPTRAWELLIGSVIALGAVPDLKNQKLREAITLGGLGMILFAVFTYDTKTLFPGGAALLPCAGAGLIIYGGLNNNGNFVGNCLARKYPVFIGLISYSLYLWHWPLIVFAKYYNIEPLTKIESGGIVVFSGVIAYLSWKFIERPFRWKDGVFRTRRTLFPAAATLMILALIAGGLIDHANGFPENISPRARAFDAIAAMPPFCDNASQKYGVKALCQLGPTKKTPEALVWGDSHAQSIQPAFADAAEAAHEAVLLTTLGGCIPFLEVYDTGRLPPSECRDHNNDIVGLIKKLNIKNVYLVARWPIYVLGNPPRKKPQRAVGFIHDDQTKEISFAENKAVFVRGLERTLTALESMGVRVTILGSVPLAPYNVARTLSKADKYGRYDDFPKSFPVEDYHKRVEFVNAVFTDAVKGKRIRFYNLGDKFCDMKACRLLDGDTSLYRDDNHISEYAAKKYVPDITKLLLEQE